MPKGARMMINYLDKTCVPRTQYKVADYLTRKSTRFICSCMGWGFWMDQPPVMSIHQTLDDGHGYLLTYIGEYVWTAVKAI